MKEFYSKERNVQILIGLLKANNIKKIVASPGSTNIPFVLSLQNDGEFEIYSCVDERSAAYMAVGMSAESGEPVVLTCTGATASRNYFSGLTEAFYRRLPILAVTSTRPLSNIGNHIAQVIDRTAIPNDIVKLSVFAPLVRCNDDEWDCQLKINRAIATLKKNGGGPVHINLETESCFDFSVKELKGIHPIKYYTHLDEFPEIPKGKVAVYIGSHAVFAEEEIIAIDTFCQKYNGAVYCDQTSNYSGKFKILASMAGSQDQYMSPVCNMDLMIYIGDITGAYEIGSLMPKAKTIWRVSEDGELRDPSKTLSKIFHMTEVEFFSKYTSGNCDSIDTSFYELCKNDYHELYNCIPNDLPFSNLWIAYTTASRIPQNSVLHFAILNSLRSWNYFETHESVRGYSNVGGFGIDGNISAMIGASLCKKDRIFFCIVGDLSFFYDMNVLGNRHIGNNVRILIINNGRGMEFRNYIHPASKFDNETVDAYISAGGHFGIQSPNLVQHYAEDLGFEYLTASNKEKFNLAVEKFISPEITNKPIVFEVFTKQDDENEALHIIRNLKKSSNKMIINAAKKAITTIAGEEALTTVKNIIRNR